MVSDALTNAPSLSTGSAFPNQIVNVSHPSIVEGDVIDVTFHEPTGNRISSDSDYSATVTAIAALDGAVDVAVPPYIDMASGEFSTGQVVVTVNGATSSTPLIVEDFLELDLQTDGQVTVALLDFAADNYLETLNNLQDMAQELPDISEAISEAQNDIVIEFEKLQSMIDEINTNGTLTVRENGSITVLSLAQLNQLDIWNLHALVAGNVFMDSTQEAATLPIDYQPRSEGTASYIRQNWLQAMNSLEGSDSHGPEFRQTIIDLFQTPVIRAKEWGLWSLNKGLGMLGLMCSAGGTLATGGAAHVANAAGIAVATLNTLVSSLQAIEFRKNTDDFLNRRKGDFDEGIEFLSQFVRIASQYLSSYGTGSSQNFGTLVNVLTTLKDLLADAGISICETLGPSAPFCGGEGTPTPALPDWDSGCGYDNVENNGGATAIWSMGDPVPYTGRGLICSDRNSALWLTHNGVTGSWQLVDRVDHAGSHPAYTGCYSQPAVTLRSGTVIGGDWLCPL